MKITSLKPGQVVGAGYVRSHDSVTPNEFVHFVVNEKGVYDNWAQLKEDLGVSSMTDLGKEGIKVDAVFRDIEGEYTWQAYLWNGCFRVGTSADRLVLRTL